MALTETALQLIKANHKLRSRLAIASGRTEYTIVRWVDNNDDNLTKAALLQVIREETGLTDQEILKEQAA